MRDDRERLLDIREAIANVDRYAARGRDAFFQEELIQTWIIHHIQIIGEAASGLSSSFREQHPDIPWLDIISMRNVLVHHYFGIDLEEIWDTITTDLDSLKSRIDSLLRDLSQNI